MLNINDKINMLTIAQILKDGTRTYYICECECGNTCKVRSDYISKKQSCGCTNIANLENKTFNHLTAIKCIDKKHGKAVWLCKCKCGNTTSVVGTKLTSGEIQSCGCLKHTSGKHSKRYRGCGDLSGYTWSSIKSCARTRDIKFDITIEYAWELFQQQNAKCAISGLDIVLCDRRHGYEITASLDRIDSQQGYIKGNVQWVHKHVNKIKQDFNEEYFEFLCTKIYEHNQDCIEVVDIPDWHTYFLQIALVVSSRSKDAQSKHGCVITTKQHRIIGTGYNSFVSGMPDSVLANKRPKKYKNMLHSEENAISNCVISPHTFTEGCIAYITGKPCYHCLMCLAQNNINEIYVLDRHGWIFDNDEIEDCNLLIQAKKIKYEIISL